MAQAVAIMVASQVMNLVLPVGLMLGLAGALGLYNMLAVLRSRHRPADSVFLFEGLVVDSLVLTAQLGLSGASLNPFVSFYMLPLILGASWLSSRLAWWLYALILSAYAGLAILTQIQPLPTSRVDHFNGLVDQSSLHINSLMAGYGLCAGIIVALILHIRLQLTSRDLEIQQAALRESRTQEGLRLGLMAAHAAHELGSPLTAMSVILHDLKTLPSARRGPGLKRDVDKLYELVETSRNSIHRVLADARSGRGGGGKAAPLYDFLHDLITGWAHLRPEIDLSLDLTRDFSLILADQALAQVIETLLDNAHNALKRNGHNQIEVVSRILSDTLELTITDDGPGMPEALITELGTRPLAQGTVSELKSGNRPRGLGLYLANGTLAALGGQLELGNRQGGGASVGFRIPLECLRIRGDQQYAPHE